MRRLTPKFAKGKMSHTFEDLEQKVDLLLTRFEQVKKENSLMRAELNHLRKELDEKVRDENDRSGAIRSKLNSVLGKIEELEKVAG